MPRNRPIPAAGEPPKRGSICRPKIRGIVWGSTEARTPMLEFVPRQTADKSRAATLPLRPLLLFPFHQIEHLLAVVDVELLVDVGEVRVDGTGGKP